LDEFLVFKSDTSLQTKLSKLKDFLKMPAVEEVEFQIFVEPRKFMTLFAKNLKIILDEIFF